MSMDLSVKDLAYLGSFFVLFLLVLFLGESFLFIPISGVLVAWCLSQYKALEWSNFGRYQSLMDLWLLFVAGLGISTLFTHSWPLTLDALVFYLTSFVVFWFFLLKKDEEKEIWQWGWVLIALVIAIFSLILLFFPDLGKSLPGTNFAFSIYGHNHSAVILILVLPLSWYLASTLTNKRRWILPLFLTLALFTTFARIAIILGLIESLLVFRWLKPTPLTWIKQTVIGIFLALLLLKVFFSLLPWLGLDASWCPIPQLQTQLCKPLAEEHRLWYWQQASQSLSNYPLVGYGPGTFQLVNRLYRQTPYILTAYAHNSWLQLLSEGGLIVGVPFVLLTGYLFKKSGQMMKGKKNIYWFMSLGVGVLFINALFDFDWQLLGVWIASLLFLATTLKQNSGDRQIIKQKYLAVSKGIWFLISMAILVLAAVFLLTEGLLRQNKIDQAFKVFPAFSSHQLLFAQEYQQLFPPQQSKLKNFYFYHSIFNHYLLSQGLADSETAELKKHLVISDPWVLSNDNNLDFYLRTDNVLEAEEEVLRIQNLVKNKNALVEFEYDYKLKTAIEVAKLADKKAEHGDFEGAGDYYLIASNLEPGVMDQHQPAFFDNSSVSHQQLEIFLNKIASLPPDYFGWNQDVYAQKYIQLIEEKIAQHDLEKIETYAQRAKTLAPWKTDEIDALLQSLN